MEIKYILTKFQANGKIITKINLVKTLNQYKASWRYKDQNS